MTHIFSEPELEQWGEAIGRTIETPAFITLSGDLGAGKSVLARAIARGAGVAATMPSPTYNLMFRYSGAGGTDIVHLDLYRLEEPADVWALGWRELGGPGEIVLVEWPERAGALLPPDRCDICIEGAGTDLRAVTWTAVGHAADLPAPEPAA